MAASPIPSIAQGGQASPARHGMGMASPPIGHQQPVGGQSGY
jgi:hypothetical protein